MVETKKHLEKVRNILLQSQTKWSGFSQNLLKIAEDFYYVMEKTDVLDKVDQKWLMESVAKLSKYKKFLMDLQKEKDMNNPVSDHTRDTSPAYQNRQHDDFPEESIDPNQGIGNGSFSDSRSASYVTYYKNQHDLYQLQYDTAQEERMRQYDYDGQQMEEMEDHREMNFVPLDYKKIKMFLFHSQEEAKVCITLQALRNRINRSRHDHQRKHIICFSEYDILGCKNEVNDQNLLSLLKSSEKIIHFTIALIDTLVNENIGKKYIYKQKGLIERLFEIMRNEDGETALRRTALVVFQKLSLERDAQSQMIKLDVIKWTVNMLKIENGTLGDYTLEYATALLMNLSLRSQGKKKCEELDADILKVLNELLEHDNLQVRTYVNGTLYCILERRKLREEARALNMDQVLRYLSNKSEARFQRQIKYILTHLENNKDEEGDEEEKSSEDSEDEMEDMGIEDNEDMYNSEVDDDYSVYDEEEDELDKVSLAGDDVDNLPRGEKWLMQEFLAGNEEAIKQNQLVSEKLNEFHQERQRLMEAYEKKRMEQSIHTRSNNAEDDRPHMRPLTPNKFATSNNNTSIFEPDSSSRNLPSEIRSRPQLGRTPPDGESRSRPSMSPMSRNNMSIGSPSKSMVTDNADITDDGQPERKPDLKQEKKLDNGIYIDHSEEKKIVPNVSPVQQDGEKKNKVNEEKLKDPEKVAEFEQAFIATEKIRRTPPKEAKMRYIREKKKKMQQQPHLYY